MVFRYPLSLDAPLSAYYNYELSSKYFDKPTSVLGKYEDLSMHTFPANPSNLSLR